MNLLAANRRFEEKKESIMAQFTVNEVIQTFKGLSLADKEVTVEILEKQVSPL